MALEGTGSGLVRKAKKGPSELGRRIDRKGKGNTPGGGGEVLEEGENGKGVSIPQVLLQQGEHQEAFFQVK